MKSNIIRACLAIAALLIAPLAVQAADLRSPYKAPEYSAPSYFSWTGFYVGINAGYGFGNSDLTDALGTSTGDFNVNGALAGLTLGYNYQTGMWVWGLEADGDYSWIKGTTTTACGGTCEIKNTWLATARARIGYAGWNRWLPYITGGAAFGNVKISDAFGEGSETKFGWTAGAGLEYAFWSNWTTKIEYLYADLGTASCTAPSCGVVDVDGKFNVHLIRLGLNYRF